MGTGPESGVGYRQRRVKIVLGKKRSLFFPPCILSSWQIPGQITKRKENGLLTSKSHVTWKPSQDGWLRMAKQSVVARFGNGGELESDSTVGLGAKFRAAGGAWPGL